MPTTEHFTPMALESTNFQWATVRSYHGRTSIFPKRLDFPPSRKFQLVLIMGSLNKKIARKGKDRRSHLQQSIQLTSFCVSNTLTIILLNKKVVAPCVGYIPPGCETPLVEQSEEGPPCQFWYCVGRSISTDVKTCSKLKKQSHASSIEGKGGRIGWLLLQYYASLCHKGWPH